MAAVHPSSEWYLHNNDKRMQTPSFVPLVYPRTPHTICLSSALHLHDAPQQYVGGGDNEERLGGVAEAAKHSADCAEQHLAALMVAGEDDKQQDAGDRVADDVQQRLPVVLPELVHQFLREATLAQL